MTPPPVADAVANASLNAASNGAAPDARTRAGKAMKRLKTSTALHGEGQITTPEHGDQFIYATATALAGNLGAAGMPAGAPAWAHALANQMNALFDNMDARFDNMDARFNNVDARLSNGTATEHDDRIVPLTNAAGLPPPPAIFPNTFGALLALNSNHAGALLVHYGLQQNPRATRNVRLGKFLGVRH